MADATGDPALAFAGKVLKVVVFWVLGVAVWGFVSEALKDILAVTVGVVLPRQGVSPLDVLVSLALLPALIYFFFIRKASPKRTSPPPST